MRKLTTFFCLVLAILFLVQATTALSPGVAGSVNTNALNRLVRQLAPSIFEGIRNMPIPGANGKKLGVKWGIENIRVTSLDLQNIIVNAGDGIYVDFSNVNLSVEGDFSYKILFFKTGRCRASANVNGGGIKYRMYIHPGEDSRLNVDVESLHFHFPKAKIRLHGSFIAKILQFIINIFTSIISNTINAMRGPISEKFRQVFTQMMNRTILRIPVEDWGMMDFALTKSVEYPEHNIIASFDGKTAVNGQKAVELERHNISLGPHENLLQVRFDSFFFNSFFQAFHTAKIQTQFYKTLTAAQPEGFPYPLNVSGDNVELWDNVSPVIREKYLGQNLNVPMTLQSAPKITLNEGSITVEFEPLLRFMLDDNFQLFSVVGKTKLTTTATIAQREDGTSVLLLQLSHLGLVFETADSVIGPINFDSINDLTKFTLDIFVLPIVNTLISNGFPLPSTPALRYVNSEFRAEPNALYLSFDLQYEPHRMAALLANPL